MLTRLIAIAGMLLTGFGSLAALPDCDNPFSIQDSCSIVSSSVQTSALKSASIKKNTLAPIQVVTQPIQIKFYYSPQCVHCREIKYQLIPKLKQKYGSQIQMEEYDILNQTENLKQILLLFKKFDKGKARVPALQIGDRFLVGSEINLIEIEKSMGSYKKTTLDPSPTATAALSLPALGSLILAGLIDGINPCAFATLLFFISYLHLQKKTAAELLKLGMLFIAGVFLAYFLLGLGLLHLILKMKLYHLFSSLFSQVLALGTLILAGISFYDFWIYHQTGNSQKLVLKLPQSFKMFSHLLIRKGFQSMLAPGIFAIGFAVAFIEAACTGQVYVPILGMLAKQGQIHAWLYLLLYNFLFVLPLIAILLLSFMGLSSQKLQKIFQNQLGLIKLLTAVLFLVMSLVLWKL